MFFKKLFFKATETICLANSYTKEMLQLKSNAVFICPVVYVLTEKGICAASQLL